MKYGDLTYWCGKWLNRIIIDDNIDNINIIIFLVDSNCRYSRLSKKYFKISSLQEHLFLSSY